MTKISEIEESDNSPENQVLRNLTIAMAQSNTRIASDLVTDDIVWTPIGRRPVLGVEAFCKAFSRYGPATALAIDHVISSNRSGAVNGVIEWDDNRRAFCHVYELSGDKGLSVKALTSYAVRLK